MMNTELRIIPHMVKIFHLNDLGKLKFDPTTIQPTYLASLSVLPPPPTPE
jgi:hypothetical protein